LKFGPPASFSPIFEAINCPLSVQECLSFGDISKNIFSGPSTVLHAIEPFVPMPIETAAVMLPNFALEVHWKFAENLHELWAMRKIDLGWIYGEVNI
jgi:ryanodine receptor 2